MNITRRGALGLLGTIGAASGAVANDRPASPSIPDPRPWGRVRGRFSGAEAASRALGAEGVPCVFGVPGAQNNELWDVFKGLGIPYLLVSREGSASIMADASARVTGRVGVFAVVPGPGITNAITGIGEALHDSVPIVGIVTDILRGPDAPIGQVHGLANAALLRPVCKAVFEVSHVSQIPGAIHQAHQVARSGEPGPASVVIPYNLYSEVWDFDEPTPAPAPVPWDESAYRRALGILSDRSRRVGIYAGQGSAGAVGELIEVAEALQAPVATSVSGKGAIPDDHPLAVGWGYGAYGTRAAESAFRDLDVVLAVGVKYSEVSTANYAYPKDKTVIHVDANPANLGHNLPTCVAVAADAPTFLRRLRADRDRIVRPPCPPLWNSIREGRARDLKANTAAKVKHGVDPMHLYLQLRCALAADDLLFVDVTASVHWAAEAYRVPGPRRFFTPTDNQGMGWAIPAAIGAQRVRLDRKVVAVAGDGCFLMSGLEPTTASRSALPVKIFVLDDGGYHYMQMLQEPAYGRTTATELPRLDYRALAQGMGLAYSEIDDPADLAPGVARTLAAAGPVLTRVRIGYEGREIRWLSALKSSYLDRQTPPQLARMAGRALVRSTNPFLKDD